MAQTNVMVSYAPARRPAPPVGERDGRRLWGTALAGALLAGGAVFALGTFVRPDGSLRDTGLPSSPRVPLATADRATAPPLPEARLPEPQSPPLPYLALVKDVAPAPAPPTATLREVARPAARDAAPAPRRVAMRAVAVPVPAAGSSSTEDAGLAPPPAPEPVTGQRRDLEGFLGEQGLVLAAPPPQASEAIAPVAEWSADDLAPPAPETPAVSTPASDLAPAGTAPPALLEPGLRAAVAEPIEDAPAPIALIEVSEPASPQPVAGAETQRLAELAPAVDEPAPVGSLDFEPSGYPDRAAAAVSRLALPSAPEPPAAATSGDGAAAPVSRLVLPPAPTPPAAGTTAAPTVSIAQSFPVAVVNGEALGAVTLRDFGPQGQTVHLGALVGLLKLRMPEAQFAWLSSAAAADQFVTLDQLRAAGITVQLDARNGRLLIDAR